MAYIGKNLVGILKEQKTVDTMTGDGSDTTLTLSDTPGSVNNVLVFFDGIRQTPITDYTLMGTTLTFTTAPEASVNVVAISGNWSGIVPKMGSVTSSKIVDGMVMDANIVTGVASSKLTGALPAISGANLTGIVSDTGITTNASDPTISTNPAGGVGTVWANSTSGEMYVLTDATAGANVWINVGPGIGNVAKPFGGTGGGTISGFYSGGYSTVSPLYHNIIDKFAFSSNVTATDHGDLTIGRLMPSGSLSTTHGYIGGGSTASTPSASIDKYAFASAGNATSHGNLSTSHGYTSGQSSSTHGFTSGGNSSNIVIDKFAFASNVTGTNHGSLVNFVSRMSGHSSYTDGYTGGGVAPQQTLINKFSFASSGNATDHGDLTVSRGSSGGSSSTTHGYTAGGEPATNVIDRFAYGSGANSTDHGDLSSGRSGNERIGGGGVSSVTHGFTGGGIISNIIDKFSFASNTTAADFGDLSFTRRQPAGTQY